MKTRLIVTIAILLLSASLSTADQLYTKNKKANKLYKKGEYQEALKLYDDLSIESPAEPKIKMNKGSALYQLKDLDRAEESYKAAAAGCNNKKTLADLYYNLGNIQYMQGEELSGQGKQEAMEKYKGALENYIKSLDNRPHDRDTKWNLQLASLKIKQMQNQNKNDKKDKNKNQDQKQNQQQNDNKQNKDQQNKDQQNKDQEKKNDKQQENKEQQNQQNDKKQEQQKPEPTPAQKKEDIKKDEAKKLLELYSDDEHDLNKKPEKEGIAKEKRNEKDW